MAETSKKSSIASRRKALEHHLGSLLGFDDVSDVLEHLLTIDTSEDLLEYLSQLLGLDEGAVVDFVEDISRFRGGQELIHIAVLDDDIPSPVTESSEAKNDGACDEGEKPNSWKEQWDHDVEKRNGKKSEVEKQLAAKQIEFGELEKTNNKRNMLNARKQQQRQQGQKNKSSKVAAASVSVPAASAAASAKPEQQIQKKNAPSNSEDKEQAVAAKSSTAPAPAPPPRGKPEIICGCFGAMHKPLTNCLYCGRIACSKEGCGYCAFCGFLIEKVTVVASDDGKVDKVLLHKERLLKFDREFTKRTVVLDDQADYFSNSNSLWLNEDERADADERDDERRRDIHERKKQVLSIHL